MIRSNDLKSIPNVCEIHTHATPGVDAGSPADLLIEVPHGADSHRHYAAVRERLIGDLPDDLEAFYFVNTDIGAFDCASAVARRITSADSGAQSPRKVLIVRSIVPRTFVDCNRDVEAAQADPAGTGITPGLPEYITSPEDVALLTDLHREYGRMADRAYARVCGTGGLAVMLHTYAPRSVRIDRIDANIVTALRRAYEPARYAECPRRPDVDLITESEDGVDHSPPGLVAALRDRYLKLGIRVAESETYRLHPATMGYRYSARFAGQVLCVEFSRELLVERFIPFEAMSIVPQKVERMAAPLAAALSARLDRND